MKGQFPKAYLRIDPNLDQTHPDPGAFLRLLCAAARQPRRGRFKTRLVAEAALGKKRVATFLARRDLIEAHGGLEVDGWDIWQEGDFTVGERMRRYRARHTAVTDTVTDTVTPPSRPSEASGSRRRNGLTDPPLTPPDGGASDVDAFDLPPGLTADKGNGHGRKARAQRLEEARLYAVHVGFHPNRADLREMKSWVTAGRSLPEIQRALDIAWEQKEAIAPGKRPRL